MLGIFAAHRVAVPVKFAPHGILQLALPVVILEETTEKLPSQEKEKERKKTQRELHAFLKIRVREF